MRWFFLILVSVNVVLFAWFQQEQAQRERMAAREDSVVPGVQALQLLSESAVSLRERQMPKVAPSVISSIDETKVPVRLESVQQCTLLSGFEDEMAVDDLLRQLPHGIMAELVYMPQEQTRYLVFLSTPEDKAEVDNMLAKLDADGFEVEVVSEGELAGQYLLGNYRSFELAQALFRSLEQKKYSVDILTASDEQVQPALQIYPPESATQAETLQDRLASFSAEFKTEKKTCQGVDSIKVGE